MNDCLLTLVFPLDLKEELLDEVLAHPEWGRGFTCMEIEGHGSAVPLQNSSEEVRGRSRYATVQIALPRAQAEALLAALRTELPNRRITYWITPLLDFGRVA
jgi:hypothetical protein